MMMKEVIIFLTYNYMPCTEIKCLKIVVYYVRINT